LRKYSIYKNLKGEVERIFNLQKFKVSHITPNGVT